MLVYTETSTSAKGESVESNKYYNGKIVQLPNGQFEATLSWGRIGAAKGQSKSELFFNEWSAKAHVEDKFCEKRRKGYREIDDNEYRRLVGVAQLVGLSNKVGRNFWMEKKGETWVQVQDVNRLMEPSCKPGFFVEFVERKSDATYAFLFTADGTFIQTSGTVSNPPYSLFSYRFSEKVDERHPLAETVAKVHQAMFA